MVSKIKMKCGDARTFFSQISNGQVTMQVPQPDLMFLSSNGYIAFMQKDEYDKAFAEAANLDQMNQDLQREEAQEVSDAATLRKEDKKTHSLFFHFEGKDKKQAEIVADQNAKEVVSKETQEISEKQSAIAALIQKKSMMDRMVQYDGAYVGLTGLGTVTLNDLNIRNYRVSDDEFSSYIAESKETADELRSIAEVAGRYESAIRSQLPKADLSQLWGVSIGLAKIQGDENQIRERFFASLQMLQHFDSNLDNKLMAAEVMTSIRGSANQAPGDNSDLQGFTQSLKQIDHDLRHHDKVPKELSAGVAATILAGKRFDGSLPMDRFAEFSKMTRSYESAAILASNNIPVDQLANKLQEFRMLFNSFGYELSEDSELASCYLAISSLEPNDVRTKLTILIDALRNYLEYPLVAGAVLASIETLEANETLDLMERAYAMLVPIALGLERSELVTLAVRMIHGIRNELVKQLDPTAKIANTPVQYRYYPSGVFYPYFVPLIVAHSAYYSTYSGIGGAHPAHVHGGGFSG
jgi:hypothetical protein